jgi:imidazole glycerol phosphate synthase subunit HisF
MAKPGTVIGWLLAEDDRGKLLQRFKPKYEKTVAHHVTLRTDAANEPRPPEVEAQIVGRADDEKGVEAMVVAIDGSTDRPDGSTYHITWSLGPGRRARESNDVLEECGWQDLDHPIPIRLEPGRF